MTVLLVASLLLNVLFALEIYSIQSCESHLTYKTQCLPKIDDNQDSPVHRDPVVRDPVAPVGQIQR